MSTPTPPPADREALEREIVETRRHLAETADALVAKADVKAQAQHKIADAKASANEKVADLRAQAGQRAHAVSDRAPGSPKQQSTALLVGIVAATALGVWLVVRRKR